uniref:Uncharacterized protein n=1 Tax=Nelumbo nucifera TaxID=4432 RepID=A0A822YR21_NELNU|nr:TPA_asm: hypothetical protein HUJ06_005620 [Nelumbo nucifera]
MQSISKFYHSLEAKGIPKHKTHDIGDFEYCDKYGDNCDFPHTEEWRKQICISTVIDLFVNYETFRDTWNDEELLKAAYQCSHFTQFGPQDAFNI